MFTASLASYLLAALAALIVLEYHLLSAVVAGLAVYVLTAKLARHLPRTLGGKGHGVALIAIILIVVALVSGGFIGLWAFLQSHEGMAALLPTVAKQVENMKQTLPASLSAYLPDSVNELRQYLTQFLREHAARITHFGISGTRVVVHVLAGMIIGGIAVLHRLKESENLPPLAAALHLRLAALTKSFERVVFAQVKISALNTVLSALYLAVILPFCGVHLPVVSLLVALTFIAGLLPVVGNLVSGTVILLVSLGDSVSTGAASLGFLLLIHKLEYFTNAKIVGSRIKANSYELLSAMLVMEAVFGLSGLVAAPVLYAWVKAELKEKGMV